MARCNGRLGGACATFLTLTAASAQPVSGLFSVDRDFTATHGPHAGAVISHGDLIRTTGVIARTNIQLIDAFCKKPVARDVGLDALFIDSRGNVLFSVEDSFFAECGGFDVSHGDLLSTDGAIVRTNAQLMGSFHPKPIAPDVGLDAVFILNTGEIFFSSEEDLFDTGLGVLSQGDVLSDQGRVVRTNRELMRNFHPQPPVGNMGLDTLVVRPNGEIWWSSEIGWFDEQLGIFIGDGDLLSDAGYVVASESQLLTEFLGDKVPTGIGLDAFAFPARFAECGTVEPGPQGCPVFRPDGSAETYFIENTDAPPGHRVFVSGELNPDSTLCPPLRGPGIENNVIGLCFEGCGTIGPGPQGCPIFRFLHQTDAFYYIENIDIFPPLPIGSPVFVRGILNTESTICLPPGGPAIEHNILYECFSGCGELVAGPQGCPQLLPDGDKTALFIENLLKFQLGDHVFVQGPIIENSQICGPFTTRAIEDNGIGICFEGCGTLVRGAECTLFAPDAGGVYRLSNYGDFQVGDEVFVRGLLEEICFSTCQEGGCISANSIARCCPCDWNAHDGVNSQDLFDFLQDFFNGNADFNHDTFTNSQDFFDFLRCFFEGC